MANADRGTASGETIAAIATPPGRGGVGIVRASGPRCSDIARAVAGRLPKPRVASYCTARDASGTLIDQGLCLYFAGPASFTGEDVVEFHGHGGPASTGAVLQAFLAAGARLARPGEFTERAFLNDKIDLAQAEAVADLIEAQSAEAARLAMRSLSGQFSQAVQSVVAQITELRALVEAMLDFPEEEVDRLHAEDVSCRLEGVRKSLYGLIDSSRAGRVFREGLRVAITGLPNVGKSSLLNRLAGQERAIVTPLPGTTRDVLRESLVVNGVPITVADTAGLRDTGDVIEREGIARAKQEAAEADVVLLVMDASDAGGSQEAALSLEATLAAMTGKPILRAFNKVDLVPTESVRRSGNDLWLSARTGEGVKLLQEALVELAGVQSAEGSVFLARERHLRAMEAACQEITASAAASDRWELLAEHLRLAQGHLGSITGEVTADDLLGEIFSRFCIGK